jgi:hypothetical protein
MQGEHIISSTRIPQKGIEQEGTGTARASNPSRKILKRKIPVF